MRTKTAFSLLSLFFSPLCIPGYTKVCYYHSLSSYVEVKVNDIDRICLIFFILCSVMLSSFCSRT